MQQYREIKARYPQTILFFRMGDFYEMFEDDARLAARELGLTLTSRNNGGAAEVPLAGVPVKAGTEYLRRLIAKGHRVAICEQVEDPKLAKGLVRREVVETITPGTVLAEDWLERKRNNFLLALDPRGTAPGLAALDLSTGELALETVPLEDLASALARYEAPEVVLPAGCELALLPGRGSCAVTEREAWEFDPELAREDLVRTFRLASLDGLGVEPGDRAAVGAAGALLRYARELKPGGLPHLARPRVLRGGAVVPLDDMTRRNLELVEPLRPGASGATVLEVLDRTMTPMGARLLRRWLLAPLVDPAAINARLDAVEVLVRDPRGRDRVREALDGVRDLERLAGRAALGRATPRELGALRDSIARLPDVRSALDGLEARGQAAALEQAAERFDLLADLGDGLAAAVGGRGPRVQTTAGIVAELDVWSGLADLAHREAYVRPQVTADFTIELEASRHPVVERMMAREAFIPNDVRLDEGARVILLTGPNMAGKSTLLRQVGLCVLLAQVGCFVPARRAVIGVVDRLFTRVGASDNLVRGQSTFMVEMSETSAILHGATARSLVLLDEIGRGTSTYDGVAIAWAFTEHLHNVIGCKTVFATHYHELTQLTEELAHARNFNVAVREAGDEIVFLHRLEPGGADRSYGIHVGRLAGLPGVVVGRAWEVLKLLEAGHHVARQPPPPAPDAQQLGLFAPRTHPLVAELDRLDVNTLSPLEALNRLAAWKKRLEEAS